MTQITQFPIPAIPIPLIPLVTNAAFADVFVVDQSGSTNTETAQQLFNLFLPNLFLSYAGNPNGNLAGTAYQICYDTTHQVLYVCTVTGNSTSAVWTLSSSDINAGITWFDVTIGSATMGANSGYVCDSSTMTTLTLPLTCPFGAFIYVSGRQHGWTILQNTGQKIFVSPETTTVTTGSLSSTNPRDCVLLQCCNTSLEFNVISQQSAGLTIV